MSRTSTRYVSFETLNVRGASAVTVVKLMMACNDLSLANQALTEWKKDQPRNKKSRQIGAGMYFIRMQIAHLNEGFKVIKAISEDSSLMNIVRQCDQQTQQSFNNLKTFLHEGSNHDEYNKLIEKVRHNMAFHYNDNGKLIKKAISEMAEHAETRTSSITRGSTAHLWHFKIADDVVDRIVVREIWKIPRNVDVGVEADKVADRTHQIFLWFVDFSGEFIWRYCQP